MRGDITLAYGKVWGAIGIIHAFEWSIRALDTFVTETVHWLCYFSGKPLEGKLE